VGQVHTIPGGVAPPFAHAVETFLFAHVAPCAWPRGTVTKYRQTLTALDTGAEHLTEAFTAAFGELRRQRRRRDTLRAPPRP
jgi:hypothetical protein